jgi:hypothetical protein
VFKTAVVPFPRLVHAQDTVLCPPTPRPSIVFLEHLPRRTIARQEHVSRWFVKHWTQSPTQVLDRDERGWKKNRGRHYTARDEQRVLTLHQELDDNARVYFAGASAILQEYQRRYPNGKLLPLRYIGRVLAKHGLSAKPKVRRKGASRYLHYPATLIDQIGSSLLEIDFIGKKFIDGQTEPLNFIGFSLTKPRRLKHFQRVASETAREAITHCDAFFDRFEEPEVVKIDNGFAFAGSGSEPRVLNSFALFLLRRQIIPVFTAPRKPWNQASIEGSNSIFSRKFWHRERYTSPKMVDERLKWFNASYQRYSGYRAPKTKRRRRSTFIPKVFFIRKIYQDEATKKAYIDILRERITVPRAYIGMFVLAEWNLKAARLRILYEHEEQATVVKELKFELNPTTKKLGGSVLFVM